MKDLNVVQKRLSPELCTRPVKTLHLPLLYKGNQKIRSYLKWDYALYRSQLPALMGASNDDADDEVLANASDKRNLASLAKNNFFPKHEYKRALDAGKHFFLLVTYNDGHLYS